VLLCRQITESTREGLICPHDVAAMRSAHIHVAILAHASEHSQPRASSLFQHGLTRQLFYVGLTDKGGGKAPVIISVDDKFMKRKARSIPRADVAELCFQSLSIPEAKNRYIDCISDVDATAEGGTAMGREYFSKLFKELKENCDYTINPPP
jgi:hypothetical protein